jgi:hypothetical protein
VKKRQAKTEELTLQEAATLLDVPLDYLLLLLAEAGLAVEDEARIRLQASDVLSMKAERDAARRKGRTELERLGKELDDTEQDPNE